MSIDRQAAQHGTAIDRDGPTSGRAVAEAREWLQQQGVSELPEREHQSVRYATAGPDGSSDPLSARHPAERSVPSDDADVEAVARAIALRKLTVRACTRHELDQALQAKNVPQVAIDAVLDRLQEIGLVDDASFAVAWVMSRQQRRYLSRQALRQELRAKGVERSLIDAALDNVDLATEATSARDLVERKRTTMSGLSRDVQYRRLAGVLRRRGFDAAITVRVLTDALGD